MYQYFELPGGVWTGDGQPSAYHPETRWNLIAPYVPENLSGKTVLDVVFPPCFAERRPLEMECGR